MSEFHIGNFIRRMSYALLACVILTGLWLSPSRVHASDTPEVYDLILEVKRDRQTLSPALIGVEKEGIYYLPLLELARIVQFKADADLDAGLVNGFYLSEDNRYSLNALEGTYTIGEETTRFSKQEAFTLKRDYGLGDIYVTPELLNTIWPLELSLDYLKLTLDIRTDLDLPYQLIADRERRRDKRFRNKNKKRKTDLNLPRIENDYKMFSLPAVDIASTVSWDESAEEFSETLNISGRNDLLKTEADYNFRFTHDPEDGFSFQDSRLLLTRRAYDDDQLPFGLKLFQAGDISSRPARLVDGSLRGRGLLVSNKPQKHIRDFDTITVEGFAEPGWEVELYRNQELLEFRVVDNSGEYRFENVSLNYNKTTIKVVLYGPEGQVEERVKTYDISSQMVQPGKTIYELGVLDSDVDLIQSDSSSDDGEGYAANVRVEQGINQWISAFGSFTETPTRDGDHRYVTLGANLSLLGSSAAIEAYKDLEGGSAVDFRLAGNYSGFNVNLRTAYLKDFESEEAQFGDSAQEFRTELSLGKSVTLPFGSLGLRTRLDYDKFKDGSDRTELDTSQSLRVKDFGFTHGTNSSIIDGEHTRTDGRFNATYKINKEWRLRSFLNYDIHPEFDTRSWLGELRYKGDKFSGALDVNHNFQSEQTRYGGQVSYDFDLFRCSLDADWQDDTGLTALLRTSFSLAPHGKDGNYIASSKNLSTRAAVNSRIFLDHDKDGTFSEGDEPIEGARLNIGTRETASSDAQGQIRHIGSPRNDYQNITVDQNSFENPFYVPASEGYNALLRPNTNQFIDFPIIETGFIDGLVMAGAEPVSGVRVQLLSSHGELIQEVSSAYDGFYTFEFIVPDEYTVRIDPAHDQISVPPRSVSVTSGDLFLYGIDFQILEQAEEAACTESTKAGENGGITQFCQAPSVPSGAEQPAPLPTDHSPVQAVVNRVRIGEHPAVMRITLDLSGPTDFSVSEDADHTRVIVEMPGVTWDALYPWEAQQPRYLKGYDVEKMEGGGTRLILKAQGTIGVRRKASLGPDSEKGHRIYIDVAPYPAIKK